MVALRRRSSCFLVILLSFIILYSASNSSYSAFSSSITSISHSTSTSTSSVSISFASYSFSLSSIISFSTFSNSASSSSSRIFHHVYAASLSSFQIPLHPSSSGCCPSVALHQQPEGRTTPEALKKMDRRQKRTLLQQQQQQTNWRGTCAASKPEPSHPSIYGGWTRRHNFRLRSVLPVPIW